MQVAKLHRCVSPAGPAIAAVLAANALAAAENEGWCILPPVMQPSAVSGFRPYGRLKREARLRG